MATIEFSETARLVFRMPSGSTLIVNPRQCKGDKEGKVWPHCSGPISKPDHECKENVHGPDSSVPVSRFVDNQYGSTDYASPWFAFWQEDCMDPPIWIVRASSFEAAYEDFCDEIEPIDQASLPDYLTATGEYEGSINCDGEPIDTESVNGCEIKLIQVTCE